MKLCPLISSIMVFMKPFLLSVLSLCVLVFSFAQCPLKSTNLFGFSRTASSISITKDLPKIPIVLGFFFSCKIELLAYFW